MFAAVPEVSLHQEEVILRRSAYIREELGQYQEAAKCYEQLLRKNPGDADACCQYALMELLENENREKALELYERAGRIKGAKENRNYHILKERLEG